MRRRGLPAPAYAFGSRSKLAAAGSERIAALARIVARSGMRRPREPMNLNLNLNLILD
jgi:hypothetical protein